MAVSKQLGQLFQEVRQNPFHPQSRTVHGGDLVTFRYIGQTRRPVSPYPPIVLITDFMNDLMRGVNLRYLFDKKGAIEYLLNLNLQNFSYQNFKELDYITEAFRSYKRQGISDLRMLDIKFLQSLRRIINPTDIAEIEVLQMQMKQQLMGQRNNQPKAEAGVVNKEIV
jgi:hypothetical protein